MRIMPYLKGSREFRQMGFIGDELRDLQLCLYTDADFAGHRNDLASTSSFFMALTGTHSFWPLCGQSKNEQQ